jgi:hypothetical protein
MYWQTLYIYAIILTTKPMPIDNLGKSHLSTEIVKQITEAMDLIESLVGPLTVNLHNKDKSGLCKVAEHNKLLIIKTNDYAISSPEMRSPDVDWEEFDRII